MHIKVHFKLSLYNLIIPKVLMMSSSAMGLSSTLFAASSSSMPGCHYIKYKYNNINYMKKNDSV